MWRRIGNAGEAERERRLELSQDLVGARAAGAAVGDQADPVPARDLLVRQVEHMAEQAADRRAKDVQDVQGQSSQNPGRVAEMPGRD